MRVWTLGIGLLDFIFQRKAQCIESFAAVDDERALDSRKTIGRAMQKNQNLPAARKFRRGMRLDGRGLIQDLERIGEPGLPEKHVGELQARIYGARISLNGAAPMPFGLCPIPLLGIDIGVDAIRKRRSP